MNKSDKYYLKRGKLELSMLDEEEHVEMPDSRKKNESKDIWLNMEIGQEEKIKKVSKRSQQSPQQTLKINKDIYNTLHTMGQFLTNKEQQAPNRSIKRGIKVTKKEKCATSLPISKADQIKKIDETVHMPIVHKSQVDQSTIKKEMIENLSDTRRIDTAQLEEMAIHLEYRRSEIERKSMAIKSLIGESSEIEAQIEATYQQANQFMTAYEEVAVSKEESQSIEQIDLGEYSNALMYYVGQGSTLNQENIDSILATFFKPVEPQNTFSRELKKHIENHIMAIKNYGEIL